MAVEPSTYRGGRPASPARLQTPEPGASGAGLAQDAQAAAGMLARSAAETRETDERVKDAEHRIAMLDDERRLSAAVAEHAVRLETGRTDLELRVLELRSTAAPGAEGHEEKVKALVDTWSAEAAGALAADPRLIERFKPHIAAAAGTIKTNERRFALQARAEKQVTDRVELMNSLANSLYTDPSDVNLARSLSLWNITVDAALLPEDKKYELRFAGEKAFNIRAWQGTLKVNPQGALEQLDAGRLNKYAEGNELVSLRQSAVSLIEHQAALARAEASAGLEEFREQARVSIEDVNDGVERDPGQLTAMAAQARAAGEDDLAQDLENAAALAAIDKKYAGASIAELDDVRRTIERSGDWKKDRQLVTAHTRLGFLINKTRERARSDKLGLWSEHGGRLAPFNLADPAAMNARIAQARAAAKRYGGPLQIMTEEEAAPLREEFAKGGAGDKARIILNFAGYGNTADRSVPKALLRQVAPDRPESYAVLADLATLRNRPAGQALVRQALNGWEQIRANGKIVDGSRFQGEIDRSYGPALSMLKGPARQGVMDVARGIYADAAARGHVAGFDRDLALRSFRAALGEAGDGTGGIGRGRGGTTFVLPHGMTQQDFDEVIARSGADAIQSGAFGGKDSPRWNGQPLRLSEFKQLTPVMVSDGLYMFRNRTGFVQSTRRPDQNFILDIRAAGRIAFGRAR